MALGALSIKLRCAAWRQLAAIDRRGPSHGITRRRQEHAALGVPPEPVGGAARVPPRDQVVTRFDDPDGAP